MPEAVNHPQEESGGLSSGLRSALRGALIFFVVQIFIKQFISGGGSSQSTVDSNSAVPAFDDRPGSIAPEASYKHVPQKVAPMWPTNETLDISVYLSTEIILQSPRTIPASLKIVEEKGFRMGDYNDKRRIQTSFDVPKAVQNNATLFAHFLVARSGHTVDPSDPSYDASKTFSFVRPLTQYIPKKKAVKTKRLLGGSEKDAGHGEGEEQQADQGLAVSSYYHPNFTVSVIPNSGIIEYPRMHPATLQYIQLENSGARDSTGQNGWYYPIVFINTFWQLRDHMTELNSTVKNLPLNIDLTNLANWKFSLLASLDEGMKQNQRNADSGGPLPAGGDGSEFEEIKRVLLETNIYLLTTTGIVSLLHTVFEMLAFKNDITHWRKKKDNVGISVRSILANVFMQTVIFLYLIDNSDGTSWMILFGQGLGIVLEAWKITKTVDVRLRPADPGSFLPYKIHFDDKHKLSESEEKTKEYDEIAFKYLYMVAVPLLIAYGAYSLLYESHKSWYSFVITSLVGSVYTYGFLMMVPSLYINYRLKSVAHMPARAMTYKFLNTFIDDLFAYTIKMPTLHRLATLRDDVIFFIYLYQAYAYRVDYSRVNEFGQGPDESEADSRKEIDKKDQKSVDTSSNVDEVAKASGSNNTGESIRRR